MDNGSFCIMVQVTLEAAVINILNKLKSRILLYKRYVDHCFLVVKKEDRDHVFRRFNKQRKKIQFTIECETPCGAQEGCILNFLDMHLHRSPSLTARSHSRKFDEFDR